MTGPDRVRIGSRHPQIKRLRKLVRQAKARSKERVFVVEGPTLVAAALESGCIVERVFVGVDDRSTADGESNDRQLSGLIDHHADVVVHAVEPDVLRTVLDPVSPQPVAALVVIPDWGEDSLPSDRPVLVAVELRDPGNLGTVIRSAEAAGFGGVVVTEQSVDVTNPKVVRASAGSILRLPVVSGRPLEHAVSWLKAAGHPVVATVVDPAACPYDRVELSTAAILIGNEPRGLSDRQRDLADHTVTIPMAGPSESLNVGAAAAVVAFEAARQRRTGVEAGSETSNEAGPDSPMLDGQ